MRSATGSCRRRGSNGRFGASTPLDVQPMSVGRGSPSRLHSFRYACVPEIPKMRSAANRKFGLAASRELLGVEEVVVAFPDREFRSLEFRFELLEQIKAA